MFRYITLRQEVNGSRRFEATFRLQGSLGSSRMRTAPCCGTSGSDHPEDPIYTAVQALKLTCKEPFE
jgi:hypothetical protein